MDDLGAEAHEPVDHLRHVHLVARDRVRREDHRVVGVELEPAVVALRHQRQGRHRLALAAGRDHAHLARAAGRATSSMSTSAWSGMRSRPIVAGQPHVLLHRQAERRHLAPERHGGVGDLLHPVHVAGEAGDDDAPALVLVEQVVEHLAHRALAAGVTGLVGVGRVAEQQADAVARRERADAGQVGEPAVDRREVELEVARVQDRALRRVEGGGEAVRHRVGHRDELDLARPDAPALAVAHRDQLGAVEQPGLLDAVAGQAERERRAVDRERQLAQQVAEAPHVVFVAVRDDRPVDAVGVVAQVGEVGQHEVDAEHVDVGEHQPARRAAGCARRPRCRRSCARSRPGPPGT